MKKKAKTYDPKIVIRAQRRVLRVVKGWLKNKRAKDVLITDGKGLWTVRELLHHVKGVLKLKVKK
jgi:hypothetical protein